MAKVAEEKPKAAKIDDTAFQVFQRMGYVKDGVLPADLVKVYRTFKRAMDLHTPGRMISPEGYASVVTIYETLHG